MARVGISQTKLDDIFDYRELCWRQVAFVERTMGRFKALLKETWWLWLLFAIVGTGLALLSPIFWVTYPICIFTFFWFAYIRYDEEGNFKGS